MSYTILIIEDDSLVAKELMLKLDELGYKVLGIARTAGEAIEKAREIKPQLIIADVRLEGEPDGIDAVSHIYEFHKCPVIYLTAYSESSLVKKALATNPAVFLIKPVKINEFTINIDLAIKNFREKYPHEPLPRLLKDSIFLPHKLLYQRVYKNDIVYVEADGAYVKVVTSMKNYHLTTNLKTFYAQFDHPDFFRVSRKHLINTQKVNRIDGNVLYLKDSHEQEYAIMISKSQRMEMLSRFEMIKTKTTDPPDKSE